MDSLVSLDIAYQTGFGNHHASEALSGALPVGRNSPQKAAYGLYAEQFSGTAFTTNQHTSGSLRNASDLGFEFKHLGTLTK